MKVAILDAYQNVALKLADATRQFMQKLAEMI
jgi:hypothetical protein